MKKQVLSYLVLGSMLSFGSIVSADTIVSGTDNTVAPTSTSTFVTGYKNNVDVRDSVVGGTMNTVRGNVDNSGANLVVGSENSVKASSSIISGWKNKLDGNNAFVGGIEAEAKGDNTFAFGLKAKAIGEGNVAIGKYSNAIGQDSMALGRDSVASATNTNALGQNAVASGENATAIGHGSESKGRNSNAFGSSANASADFSTAVGNSSKAKGVSSTATGFNALAEGNFSTAYGNDAQANGNRSVAVGYNAKAGESSVAIGNNAKACGTNAVANGAGNNVCGNKSGTFGIGNDVKQNNTYVVGNNVTTTQANSVVLGNDSTDRVATTEASAKVGSVTYGNFAGQGSKVNGVVSVGSVNKERQLINVASGNVSATSTDAVNGSQLYSVANVLGNKVAKNEANIRLLANGLGELGGIVNDHDTQIEANKVEAKKHTTLVAGNNVDITSTLNENGGAEYTVSVNRLHMGDVAIDENGLNNGGNRITNVANGVQAKDAVNVSQLNRVDAKADLNTAHINLVENNVNANTANIARIDDKVDGLRTSMDTRFDKVDSDIAKVGANSAALSALHPLSFNANEKVEYAVGYGNYKGENAVAVGVFAHPNENTLFSLGATFGGGSNMVNAGATFRFGHVNKQVTNVNTAVAKDVQDLTKKYEALAKKYDNLLKRLGMEDESVEVNTAEVEKAQRFVINRVDGEDNDAYKTERVSVNTQSEEFTYRDAYGTEMK